MFQRDRFVEDCRKGVKAGQRAIREIVLEAVSDPAGIISELGEPTKAGVFPLYCGSDATVINFVWAPCMTLVPHNHNMFAVIGIYTGREDNIFWRRIADEDGGRIEAAGAKALSEKDAAPLGPDIIHSVTNPIARLTGAIHVYGGDFFGAARSEWDPDRLLERPYDVDKNMRLFEEANDLYARA